MQNILSVSVRPSPFRSSGRSSGIFRKRQRAAAFPPLKQRLKFAYDNQGRRIRKVVKDWNADQAAWQISKDFRFVYDGWNLIEERDALNGNSIVRKHVWRPDLSGTMQGAGGVGGLLWITTPTQTFAASSDANGNIVAWINTATLAVAGRADYSPFGEPVVQTGMAKDLPFGFSAKYTDSETGLLYYGFRYYSPSLGRFLNRDPIEELGGLNLHGFVGNDPVNHWDIHGLFWNRLDDFVICMARCIEDNDPLEHIWQKALLSMSGAKLPKSLVARMADIAGDKQLARLLRAQLRNPGYSRVTSLPATLSASLRAPGMASRVLHGVGAGMGPFWLGYGVYMAAVEVACIGHCCASRHYLPEAGIVLPGYVNSWIDKGVQLIVDAITVRHDYEF